MFEKIISILWNIWRPIGCVICLILAGMGIYLLLGTAYLIFFGLWYSSDQCINNEDYCELKDGRVYDKEFEICRFDCKEWSSEKGCVLMTNKELEEYTKEHCKGKNSDLIICRERTLELSRRQKLTQMGEIK